jgi:dienelactone hydrolase
MLAAAVLVMEAVPGFGQVPLPDDIALATPGSDVPRELADFAGAWGGDAWDGVLPHALVIERIMADGAAEAVYSVGGAEQWQIKPGWRRVTGHMAEGRLAFTLSNAVADYRLGADGVLSGRYTNNIGSRSYVRLTRIATREPDKIVAAAAQPVASIWQEIRIPVRSQLAGLAGQTVMLQATLYRAAGVGRRPLVVFNHGSTGRTADPAVVALTQRFEAASRAFLSLGYSVVVPMRKGRGTSEGPFLEPSDFSTPHATQIESAVEDVDAVVDFMRAQPDVDPAKVVVAGQSRGGILSVIYAGRRPDKVKGVINFVGGWWSEGGVFGAHNTEEFTRAGSLAKVAMLWLYASGDRYYMLTHTERNFEAFRGAGGVGRLVEVRDLKGDGHALLYWPARWENDVADYLKTIE